MDPVLPALLFAGVFWILLLAISVAIAMPFHGAMIRYRANYQPVSEDLEGEGNAGGPVLTSLFGALNRTKRIEGWYGLYKGAYPTFGFTFLLVAVSTLTLIFMPRINLPGPEGEPNLSWRSVGFFAAMPVLLTITSLPVTVIINRCIVTPYRLPNSPMKSLRIILSPREYSTPYILYANPGLLLTTFLTSFAITLAAQLARSIILGPRNEWEGIAWWRWALCISLQIISAVWMTPLYVIGTRLSIQPNLGEGEEDIGERQGLLPVVLERCGNGEDVVRLRPTSEPYRGLLDCERKLVSEEGTGSLFRGWAWTALGLVLSVGN